jgi:circadian clock protein KaiC
MLRSELRRLFQWLREKGVTAVITGERGEKTLTRQGLEEYVSDCVILLDFRVIDQLATRRLRIVKYRGSTHGTNEYPFLIDENGISVLPITSLKLEHKISNEIISTGLEDLDNLFQKKGMYRGSSMLVSGSAGTAKTILAAGFAQSSCLRKEPTLYFAFEESPGQIVRNMRSVGINFDPFIKSGLLHLYASRPSMQGLERHLLLLYNLIEEYKPRTVIVDPITSLISIGSVTEVRDMLVRLIDLLKTHSINALFTALTNGSAEDKELTVNAVSSLADIWIKLTNGYLGTSGARSLRVVKARGLAHHSGEQFFKISNKGISFIDEHEIRQKKSNG